MLVGAYGYHFVPSIEVPAVGVVEEDIDDQMPDDEEIAAFKDPEQPDGDMERVFSGEELNGESDTSMDFGNTRAQYARIVQWEDGNNRVTYDEASAKLHRQGRRVTRPVGIHRQSLHKKTGD